MGPSSRPNVHICWQIIHYFGVYGPVHGAYYVQIFPDNCPEYWGITSIIYGANYQILGIIIHYFGEISSSSI